MASSSFVNVVQDPLFSLSKDTIPINGSSTFRNTIERGPNSQQFATVAVPLNASAGNRIQFQVPLEGINNRFGTYALRMKFVASCLVNGVVSDLPGESPDASSSGFVGPNYSNPLFGIDALAPIAAIDQIVLKANNQDVLYQATSGTLISDVASRLMSEYSIEAINNVFSGALFTPMGDKTYTQARFYNSTDSLDQAPANSQDPYNTDLYTQACLSHPISTNFQTTNAGPPQSLATSAMCPIVESNPYACDPCMKARVNNWLKPVGSSNRVITRIIPLNLLCPRLPDLCLSNITRLFLEISFSQKARDLLVPFTMEPTAQALGAGLSVIDIQLIMDSHTPASFQEQKTAIETVGMKLPDIVSMPYTRTFSREWGPGQETQISGISNFDQIFIYAPTDGMGAANGGVGNGSWVAGLGSLTAAKTRFALAQWKNTFSQWLPFSSPISRFAPSYAQLNGATYPLKATLQHDIIAHRATDCVNPLQNIMVLWSNHQFPQSGVNCADASGAGYVWNATQLQYEHAKAQDRICNRVFGSSIPDDVFETTMPCVHFSPHASGPKSLNNIDNNLCIKFIGGDKTYLPALNFVITSTTILKIMPSGDVVAMNGTTR